MTHPDLVERLNLFIESGERALLIKPDSSEAYKDAVTVVDMARQARAQILTLQSSLAEQEKTISKLREEVKEAKDDYLRRHNDAANAFEEIAVLQSHLAEARNSGLEEAARIVERPPFCYPTCALMIRSLKSKVKPLP